MEHLAGEGYSPFTLAGFRFGCRHFIVWLHHHRVPIRHVDASVLGRFLGHHCICFVPGVFRGRSDFAGTRTSDAELKKFVGFLVNRGLIPEITSSRQTPDDGLGAFRAWLRQHRGINAQLLTELGDDPGYVIRHLGRVSQTASNDNLVAQPRPAVDGLAGPFPRSPSGVYLHCLAIIPGRISSVPSLRAIRQRTRDCVTERSCSFSPALPCARAMFSTCGYLTLTGTTHGCACAARRDERRLFRFLRMPATRFSITSQVRVRA